MRKIYKREEQKYYINRHRKDWWVCDMKSNPICIVDRELAGDDDFIEKMMLCDNKKELEKIKQSVGKK